MPITVEGGAGPAPAVVASQPGSAASATLAASAKPSPKPQDILYQLTERPKVAQSFTPLYARPSFWTAQFIPLLALLVAGGIPAPSVTEQVGFSVGDRMYPRYSALLVLGTTALVGVVTTIVSYLPTRKIAKLQPTEALRGRLG